MRNSNLAYLCSMMMAAALSLGPFLFAQQISPQADDDSNADLLSTVVNRMEEAQLKNRQAYRAYTMTREYRLYGGAEQTPNSEVIADVHFVPPNAKTFEIEKVQGSSRGERVVRDVLEGEARMCSEDAPGAITTKNYNFKLLGEDTVEGQSAYLLQLLPKRDEKVLIRGKAWVDKNSYLIHRVQGDMAKSPSWWLKKVTMTVDFSSAAGMWLQTGSHAVADVRILGKHTFTAQVLKVQTADEVATSFSPVATNVLHGLKPQERATAAARRTALHVPAKGGSTLAPSVAVMGNRAVKPVRPVVVGAGVFLAH